MAWCNKKPVYEEDKVSHKFGPRVRCEGGAYYLDKSTLPIAVAQGKNFKAGDFELTPKEFEYYIKDH